MITAVKVKDLAVKCLTVFIFNGWINFGRYKINLKIYR